jgi:hypothetical protein
MNYILNRSPLYLLFFLVLLAPALQAQTTSQAEPQAVIQQLKAENESLKKELQQLRQLLGSAPSGGAYTASTPENRASVAASPQSSPGEAQGFWITSSSRKRHNNSCRYYQNSNGRPCGPEDGIACKICGG